MKPPHALRSHRARFAILVVVAAVGAAIWWAGNAPAEDGAAVAGSGTIEADEIALGVEMGGRIVSLVVDEGGQVAAGDVLAALDTTVLDAQVRQAESAVAVARANLALVETATREEEVRQAEGAVASALAQRDAAHRGHEDALALRDDPQDLNLRVGTASAQLEATQAVLDRLRRGATEQEIAAAEAEVAGATANLSAARARLEMLITGPTAEQIAEAEAAVRTARNQLYSVQTQADAYIDSLAAARGAVIFTEDMKKAQAGVAYEQAQAAEARLAQLKSPARPESVRQAESARDQAQAVLDAARARLARMQAGTTDEEIRLAEANVKQARANLDGLLAMRDKPLVLNAQVEAARGQYQAAEGALQSAQARLDVLNNGATEQQREASRAQLRQAEAALAVVQAQRDKAIVRAPAAGIITKRSARLGETVAPFARLLTLADLASVTLTVYVAENRIGRVNTGQTVEVKVDSFPERTFPGEVVYIAQRAEFTPRNVQSQKERASTVFAVKVRLPNPERLLKPGMPADARIAR